MAEDHRRVEARTAIAGTSMASDPEHIEAMQHDYAKRLRASAPRTGPGFGDVLEKAPAYRPDADAESPGSAAAASGDDDEQSETNASAEDSVDEKPALPRLPPDPRMRALHAAFGASRASASSTVGHSGSSPAATATPGARLDSAAPAAMPTARTRSSSGDDAAPKRIRRGRARAPEKK